MLRNRQVARGGAPGEAQRGQRGFTLIELVAVMAILAILVAIVAPAAINSERASITAQAQADSQQVRNAASQFFTSKNESEVRTPHKVTTTTKLSVTGGLAPASDTLAVETDAQQEISSRWPEMFITADDNAFTSTTIYLEDIQTSQSTHTGKVASVLLLDKNGTTIEGSDFLSKFTAIDLQTLVDGGLLNKMPDGVAKTSSTGISGYTTAPNFLWLFKKQNSSLGTNDDRAVAVFTLVKVEQIEPSGGGVATTVNLTYEQILGP